jgi:hypothetical protein
MSMTKKESAAFDAIEEQLASAFSLGWPQEPEPKPMTYEEVKALQGDSWNKLITGWFMNAYFGSMHGGRSVTQGCTNGVNHDSDCTTKTSTQGMGRMYRTRDEALLAMRWDFCRQFAKKLAWVDSERRQP